MPCLRPACAGLLLVRYGVAFMVTYQSLLMQLLIPSELSHDTIDALGDIGQLQFKDLNADKSVFQRTYASQVRRRNVLLASHCRTRCRMRNGLVFIPAP